MLSSKSQSEMGVGRSPITISEDDAVKIQFKRRCMSMPETLSDMKSIMKTRTLDESLHSTYGACSDASAGEASRIKFDKILIREYGRTVGDNPSCSCGPPVSISWEYNVLEGIQMDEYEKSRPVRRSHFEMVLPRKVRQDMLKREWDITQREIADSVRRNIKVKNQRKATVNNLGKATKMEEWLESTGRKLKRILTFQKPVSRQVKELEAKVNEANRVRQQHMLEVAMSGEYSETAPDNADTSTSSS